MEKIKAKIINIIQDDICLGREKISEETPLLNNFLDSLKLVELILRLEESFNIKISPEEVNRANFQDVLALAKFIINKSN